MLFKNFQLNTVMIEIDTRFADLLRVSHQSLTLYHVRKNDLNIVRITKDVKYFGQNKIQLIPL